MDSLLSCLVLSCLVLSFLIIGAGEKSAPAAQTRISGDYNSHDEPSVLPDGAFVDWVATGLTPMTNQGAAQTGTLILHGGDTLDLRVRVSLNAKIGALSHRFPDYELRLPKSSEFTIPVDFRPALNLHEKQLEYTTRISANISAWPEDDPKAVASQEIEARFVAYNETGDYFEVLDWNTAQQVYPYGFTTTQGQLMAQEAAASVDEGEHLEAIGSGVARVENLTEEQMLARLNGETY